MSRRDIFRSAAIVSVCTGTSRALGLVREVLMAVLFGTSLASSAFVVAFQIPNLFRRLFGEGALSAAFVPVFSETLEKEGIEQANRLAGRVMTMLGVALLSLVVIGIVTVSAALKWLPLGERAASVLPLLRIMLPYMFFICMVALCMAILNTFHHFTVPAFSPVLLNVIWIVTLLLVCPLIGESPSQRIYGVAWAIVAAGSIQLLVQLPVLWRYKMRPALSFDWQDPHVRRVLILMGPAALGMGVVQINTFVDRLLAMMAASWGPAALTYAERLIYLPLGIFATALGTVLLPTFSRQAARREHEGIRETLGVSLRILMFVMMPAAVGLTVLAGPIVRLFFVWSGGVFDEESSILTARAVWFYAPGLVAFSLHKMLVPAFYALKDTMTPVKVGLWVVGLNLVLNVVFVITWPHGYKHAGLAFATVLSSAVSCYALGRILHRRIGSLGWPAIFASWARTLAASVLMGVVLAASRGPLSTWSAVLLRHPKAAQSGEVMGGVLIGIAAYSILVATLCRPELAALRRGPRLRS